MGNDWRLRGRMPAARIQFLPPSLESHGHWRWHLRGAVILGVMLIPALFQKFVVQPNELSLETPYLKNYIAFTEKRTNWTPFKKRLIPQWRT